MSDPGYWIHNLKNSFSTSPIPQHHKSTICYPESSIQKPVTCIMFSLKNLSPRQLSFLIALVIAVPVSIGVYFYEDSWEVALTFFTILLIGGYAIISFVLERFIYRKIKLIYKLISQTKATQREETNYK